MIRRQLHSSIHRSLVTGCSFAILIAATPMNADARRQLIPDRPSVEVNLDVLRYLENRAMGHQSVAPGMPFQVGASEAVKRGGTTKVASKAPSEQNSTGRRRPKMNASELLPKPPPSVRQPRASKPKPPPVVASKPKVEPTPAPKPAPVKQPEPKKTVEPTPPPAPPAPIPIEKPISSSGFDPMTMPAEMPPLNPIPETPMDPEPPMPEPIIEAPVMPEPTVPEPLMPALPEPDMSSMQFEEFPKLEPLPDSAPAITPAAPEPLMPDLPPMDPAPIAPAAVEPAPMVAPMVTPEPMIAPAPAEPVMPPPVEPALPALSQNLDSFIGTPPEQPKLPDEQPLPDPAMLSPQTEPFAPVPQIGTSLPPLEAITGESPIAEPIAPPANVQPFDTPPGNPFPPIPTNGTLPSELPPMPSFDNVPASVSTASGADLPPPTEIAALPPAMSDPIPDMPAIEAPMAITPAGAAPEPVASSASRTIPIEFSATENEIPVSAQQQLSQLATELISSGQSVTIRPYVGGSAEESALANVIGTRRAFSIRTYLIDKGVSHFNISIDRNSVGTAGSPEKVDVIVN